jgi:hypothetical protein
MSIFQTTDEFLSWRTFDIGGKGTPFPLPTKDVEPSDLRVGDVFTSCYAGETYDAIHLKMVVKKNKKTIVVQTCTSRGIRLVALAPQKLPLQGRPYHILDFYAQ